MIAISSRRAEPVMLGERRRSRCFLSLRCAGGGPPALPPESVVALEESAPPALAPAQALVPLPPPAEVSAPAEAAPKNDMSKPGDLVSDDGYDPPACRRSTRMSTAGSPETRRLVGLPMFCLRFGRLSTRSRRRLLCKSTTSERKISQRQYYLLRQ